MLPASDYSLKAKQKENGLFLHLYLNRKLRFVDVAIEADKVSANDLKENGVIP